MANILSLSACSGHDSGAALLKDGKLMAAIEEERLNRLKHYSAFPKMSIDYCLKAAGLTHKDIHHVGLSWHPHLNVLDRLGFLLFHGGPQHFLRRLRFTTEISRDSWKTKEQLQELFPQAEIHYVEHHLAHAASAYYASGWQDAAILTMDGRGEWPTTMLAVGEGRSIRKLRELNYPASMGLFYLAFTHYLGFSMNDEYKVMGLAPYGKPTRLDFFRKALRFSEEHIVDIDLELLQHPGYLPVAWGKRYFTQKVCDALGPARGPKDPLTQEHMDIAASLQARFNEVGVEIARHLHKLTGKRRLCMAGGVAFNSVMNWKIKAEGPFEKLFVQPAAGDGGLSLGGALWLQNEVGGGVQPGVFEHAYWGPEFTDAEIFKEIETARVEHLKLKDAPRAAAQLLKDGYILGWFQGRTEFGPRALGNRSILADPRKAENKDIVNARIKFREEFRPFAPSMLEEKVDDYFVNCQDQPAAYMLFVAPVVEGKENVIPAVSHVDRTGRVQTVSKKHNPRYHALISRFEELTGVPVILNTSFNVKGEPIVNTPADAMRCFYTTGLDFLVMGDYLLHKKPVPDALRRELEA